MPDPISEGPPKPLTIIDRYEQELQSRSLIPSGETQRAAPRYSGGEHDSYAMAAAIRMGTTPFEDVWLPLEPAGRRVFQSYFGQDYEPDLPIDVSVSEDDPSKIIVSPIKDEPLEKDEPLDKKIEKIIGDEYYDGFEYIRSAGPVLDPLSEGMSAKDLSPEVAEKAINLATVYTFLAFSKRRDSSAIEQLVDIQRKFVARFPDQNHKSLVITRNLLTTFVQALHQSKSPYERPQIPYYEGLLDKLIVIPSD